MCVCVCGPRARARGRLSLFQEFCLFAVVGLVSDFFLQMFFFTTVLSIDIRRMEVRRPRPQAREASDLLTTFDLPPSSWQT